MVQYGSHLLILNSYYTMKYNSDEGKELLKNPLIKITDPRKKYFIRSLYYKIALKKAKELIFNLKKEILYLKKINRSQKRQITKLKRNNG